MSSGFKFDEKDLRRFHASVNRLKKFRKISDIEATKEIALKILISARATFPPKKNGLKQKFKYIAPNTNPATNWDKQQKYMIFTLSMSDRKAKKKPVLTPTPKKTKSQPAAAIPTFGLAKDHWNAAIADLNGVTRYRNGNNKKYKHSSAQGKTTFQGRVIKLLSDLSYNDKVNGKYFLKVSFNKGLRAAKMALNKEKKKLEEQWSR